MGTENSEDGPTAEWINQMDDPPRGEWVYGYAVCRECIASPAPERWFLYYIDESGRCYCRDCAPVTPDINVGEQSGLEDFIGGED